LTSSISPNGHDGRTLPGVHIHSNGGFQFDLKEGTRGWQGDDFTFPIISFRLAETFPKIQVRLSGIFPKNAKTQKIALQAPKET
jgi:hypothetical protein